MKYPIIFLSVFLIISGCSSKNKNISEDNLELSKKEVRVIQGIVTDVNNKPLEKSIIIVFNPSSAKPDGTISNELGQFKLEIPKFVSKITVHHPTKRDTIIIIDEREEYLIILHDTL